MSTTKGYRTFVDDIIYLVVKTPTLAPGASRTIRMQYVLSEAAAAAVSPVLPKTIAGGKVGTAYRGKVTATAGDKPITYTITSGALPAGLRLNSATGAITGTPATSGTAHFTVTASNAGANDATQGYTLAVTKPAARAKWFHDPVSKKDRAREVNPPAHPQDYRGKVDHARATARTHDGHVAVPLSMVRGRRLTRGEAVSLTGKDLFAFDSAKLTRHARAQLRTLAKSLRGDHAITCEGYTDYGGSRKHELRLSQRRAGNVCSFLRKHGVHVHVKAVGYGQARPVVIGGTPQTGRPTVEP